LKSHQPVFSFVNGRAETKVPVTDRGLNYGDGLFETILYLDGRPVLLKEHLDRLERDCQRLQICLDKNLLRKEIDVLLAEINRSEKSSGLVKIIVTRKYTGRGYGYDKNTGSNRILQFYCGLSYPKENIKGVRLSLCEHRLPDNKHLAGIKHLNRFDQVIAKNFPGNTFYQESIVFGAHGEVIECISSNIFMLKDGQLKTPDLGKAGVQGVMRDYIISTLSPALKLESQVQKLSLADLLSADELFVCNSVFGVWPVIAIHVKQFAYGEMTRSIQNEVNKLGYEKLYK